ncbi:hypothetical protein LOAG_12414, partial [Loa loa]
INDILYFTTSNFTMMDDFLNAWLVIASYEMERVTENEIQLISLFEISKLQLISPINKQYNCCAVNNNALAWQQFAKHSIVSYVYSTNITERSIKYYINEKRENCKNHMTSEMSNNIAQCSALMPRMKDGLKLIHLCYIIVIIINILLCILFAFSNLCKWFLECVNEEKYIKEMKLGKVFHAQLQLNNRGKKIIEIDRKEEMIR